MPMTKEQVLAEANQLPPETREELANALHLSALGVSSGELDAIWAEECERRLQQIERGEVKLIDGETVFEEAKQRIASRRK